MSDIQIDVPDITVSVIPNEEFVTAVTPSEIYQVDLSVDNVYEVNVQNPQIIVADGSSSIYNMAQLAGYAFYAGTASYVPTASYAFGTVVYWDNILNKPVGIVSSSEQIANWSVASASYSLIAVSASYSETSSYAFVTVSSSFSETASYSFVAVSSSYSETAISASYIETASYALMALSASYVETASYAFVGVSSSYAETSSYAFVGVSSSYSETASYALNATSASYSETASYSFYNETSSYAFNAVSSSYSEESSTATSASYSVTASYALTADGGKGFPFSGSAVITGSLYVVSESGASGEISASNINVGVPTSNNWQENLQGSYFNNFTPQTDVSEILRFIAGLLSSSAPDAIPNTRTYSTYTVNNVNVSTGTVPAGTTPQNSTNNTVQYLIAHGFAYTGSSLFPGISTIYTDPTYGHTYTSVAAGTTTVSSSVDNQLFGLGPLSNAQPTTFSVSGSFQFKFYDNVDKILTGESSSNHLITQVGAGTTSGVTLAKINTVNPNVIPAAYQDGKFVSVFSPRLYHPLGVQFVENTGYYHITGSLRIASGSSQFTSPITTTTQIFHAPLSLIDSFIPAQTPTFSNVTTGALTATSRSLSGAPYLTTATYEISGSINNLFNPLYHNSTIATVTDNNALVTVTGTSTVNITSGLINTANAVYDSTQTTVRSTGTVPYETDVVKVNGLATFVASTNDNVAQIGLDTTSFQMSINGYNKNGTISSNTSTFNFHTAGTFDQPVSSGSLAYYGRTQGTDSSTALVESFTGENFRLQLNDNILTFNGTSWNTSYGLYNLGNTDLQVKPGFLVRPGGTYGYWLTNPSAVSNYKYYVRKFSTSGTKTTMTLTVGQTMGDWQTAANNTVSTLILFESSVVGSTALGPALTTARFYDPTKTLANFVTNIASNTDGLNPFGSSIALYGNIGGTLSGTTYTIPIRNADGMYMDNTYNEIYVIIRYRGDPTPITNITVSFS